MKNNQSNRIYTQSIYEHLKGSRPRQEAIDETFDDFKVKAYKLYDSQYEYEDFISYGYPLTVINKSTGNKYKQRIQHILEGKLPSEESRRKYTKENCQSFSDVAHNKRFIVDIDTFYDANSYVKVYDTVTDKIYIQLYHVHIRGCLPKEISFSNISRKEQNLLNEIKHLYPSLEIISGYRPKWLKGKEIDIYIPQYNIGIEYNGLIYHHSDENPTNPYLNKTYKDINYHLDKSILAFKNNVKLIHIFEHDIESLNIKILLKSYIDNNIKLDGNTYEYVNTRSLLVTSKEDKHSVLISRPNVLFFKLDLPSYS